ncbi:hypothetical protein [uncultured Aquimarina sp.]|uniref:hypothetical protein n=1 Tax=uncultured Aquimarina sp. TaxID=575652 RepID=UPI002620B771|nr:hypothetical protein [uncultured Aquimarina sp.]
MEREEEIHKKITDIEAKLMEQEHRPLKVIKNYFDRNKYAKNDPRRKAVFVSFFWRLFFSPAAIAAGGSLIAIASLIILLYQTTILLEQNSLITNQNEIVIEQNNKINAQNYLVEAQRRSSLQFEVSEILNKINEELNLSSNRTLTTELKGRIIAVTIAMKPYKSYQADTLSKPYSYEKGFLFTSLLNSNIDNTDLTEILEKGNFSNMVLEDVTIGNNRKKDGMIGYYERAYFEGCYFNNVKFNNIHFSESITFENCILDNVQSSIPLCESIIFYSSKIMRSNIGIGIPDELIKRDYYLKFPDAGSIHISNSRIENTLLSSELSYFDNGYVHIQVGEGESFINGSKLKFNDLVISNNKSVSGRIYIKNSFYESKTQTIIVDSSTVIESVYADKILQIYNGHSNTLVNLDIFSRVFHKPGNLPWYHESFDYSYGEYTYLNGNKIKATNNKIKADLERCYIHQKR